MSLAKVRRDEFSPNVRSTVRNTTTGLAKDVSGASDGVFGPSLLAESGIGEVVWRDKVSDTWIVAPPPPPGRAFMSGGTCSRMCTRLEVAKGARLEVRVIDSAGLGSRRRP